MASDAKIQEFILNQLSARDRLPVCVELWQNAEFGRKVQKLSLIDCILRGLGQGVLEEAVPARLSAEICKARERFQASKN